MDDTSPPTHAGPAAIVIVRHPDGGPRVLTVTRPDSPEQALPGGHIDPNETAENAGRRELAEECGIQCGVMHGVHLLADPTDGRVVHVLEAESFTGEPKDAENAGLVSWLTPSELLAQSKKYAGSVAELIDAGVLSRTRQDAQHQDETHAHYAGEFASTARKIKRGIKSGYASAREALREAKSSKAAGYTLGVMAQMEAIQEHRTRIAQRRLALRLGRQLTGEESKMVRTRTISAGRQDTVEPQPPLLYDFDGRPVSRPNDHDWNLTEYLGNGRTKQNYLVARFVHEARRVSQAQFDELVQAREAAQRAIDHPHKEGAGAEG